MRLYAENNTNYIKSLDSGSEIKIQVIDYDNTPMNLTQFSKVLLKIGKEKLGTILTIEPEILSNGFFKFTLPENKLTKGRYNIEVHMFETKDIVRVAPSSSDFIAIVTKSLDELNNQVTTISVQQLLDDMASVKKLVEENIGDNLLPIVTANNAIDISTKANIKSDEAIDIANQANSNATNANTTSEQAKLIAEEAKSLSNEVADNLDEVIEIASQAKNKAENAELIAANSNNKSGDAINIANTAKNTAELVRQEFNQLTSGNTDAEIIEARTNNNNVTYDKLKTRLDNMDNVIESKVSKEEYESTMIDGNKILDNSIPINKLNKDLSKVDNTADLNKPVSTKQQQAIDTSLQNSKSYTDKKVGEITGGALPDGSIPLSKLEKKVSTLDEDGNVLDGNGNIVEGKVKSVNGLTGDVILETNGDGIIKQDTPPQDIVEGRLWIDTSGNTYQGTVFDGLQLQIKNLNTTVNNKAEKNIATTSSDGLMSASDKTKLDSLNNGVSDLDFNNHVNDTAKHVSSSDRIFWNAKASTSLATNSSNGLMSANDKTNLDNLMPTITSNESGYLKGTLVNGYTGDVFYKKIGRIVYIYGYINIPNTNYIEQHFMTIPSGYRPSNFAYLVGVVCTPTVITNYKNSITGEITADYSDGLLRVLTLNGTDLTNYKGYNTSFVFSYLVGN